MIPFGVTIPATVPQRSEIPEGVMNYPVLWRWRPHFYLDIASFWLNILIFFRGLIFILVVFPHQRVILSLHVWASLTSHSTLCTFYQTVLLSLIQRVSLQKEIFVCSGFSSISKFIRSKTNTNNFFIFLYFCVVTNEFRLRSKFGRVHCREHVCETGGCQRYKLKIGYRN